MAIFLMHANWRGELPCKGIRFLPFGGWHRTWSRLSVLEDFSVLAVSREAYTITAGPGVSRIISIKWTTRISLQTSSSGQPSKHFEGQCYTDLKAQAGSITQMDIFILNWAVSTLISLLVGKTLQHSCHCCSPLTLFLNVVTQESSSAQGERLQRHPA